MVVSDNTVVSIRYKIQNTKGEELENILFHHPVEYLHGAGNISPALECHLTGLNAGDKKEIFITSNSGFDNLDDDFIFEVVVDAIRLATDKEIKNGSPVKDGKLENCVPGCCC